MTDSPAQDAGGRAARAAELQAAIRYWEKEAEAAPPERLASVRDKLSECRERLAALRGDGIGDAGC